jgi:hypothetical protein
MRLIALTFVLAVSFGLLLGGHLRGLAAIRFRWPHLALVGIALQLFPIGGWIENAMVFLSFAVLLVFILANIRQPGFTVVLVGLMLNCVVISVNHGMPVSHQALVNSDQRQLLDYLVDHGGAKHHLATDQDTIRFLGDVIPIPAPVHQVVSPGDLIMYAGTGWFLVAMMRRDKPAIREPRAATPEVGA